MVILQLHPKCRIGQQLDNDTIEFWKFFFGHVCAVNFVVWGTPQARVLHGLNGGGFKGKVGFGGIGGEVMFLGWSLFRTNVQN